MESGTFGTNVPVDANLTSDKNPSQGTRGITHRALSGLFWAFSGTGLQAVLQVVVLVILARLVKPADFGLFGAALVVVGFSGVFSQLGIGPAIVQHPNLEPRHVRIGFTISLLFGVLLAGVILLIAPAIAGFFRMEGLTFVLRPMSLVFLLKGMAVVAESLLQRELQFRWLTAIQVTSYAVGYGVVGVSLAFMKFGVWALVGAHLVQEILKSTILLMVQPHPKVPQLEDRAFNELMCLGGGFTAGRIGNYIALKGDNFVVGRWIGTEGLGLYDRAYQLMALPATLFGQVLDRVLFPAMAKVQKEPGRLGTAYSRGVALTGLLTLPTSGAMIVLAPELINVLLGPAWAGAIVPVQILTIGMLFRTSYKMSDSLARATGAVYRRAWRQCVYAALVIGAAWVGQHWGIRGVSIGVLGAITMNFVFMTQLSLSLTSMTCRNFLLVHLPAMSSCVVISVEVWITAMVIRNLAMPSMVVLAASIVVTVVTLVILLHICPKLFLGRDGIWILRTLIAYVPARFSLFDLRAKLEKKV